MSPKTMALATLIALVAFDASSLQAIGTQDRAPNLSGLLSMRSPLCRSNFGTFYRAWLADNPYQ